MRLTRKRMVGKGNRGCWQEGRSGTEEGDDGKEGKKQLIVFLWRKGKTRGVGVGVRVVVEEWKS